MKRSTYLATLATLSVVALGSAYASGMQENDALNITSAKIGLGQAVSAAEQHVGGKASRAEYEQHNGKWVYDVEVVKGKEVMDVKVDPASARIVAASKDETDHDDGHDKAD